MSEKKEKNIHETPATRFHRKYMPSIYFASMVLLFLYLLRIVVPEHIAQEDQLVFHTKTDWILILAAVMMLISSMTYLVGNLRRGLLMVLFGVASLYFVLTLVGPVVATTYSHNIALRHANHVYYLAHINKYFMSPLQLLECDSLGIICDQLFEEQGNSSVIASLERDADDDGIVVQQLQFDAEQNAILWLQDGEVIYTHPLE